MARLTGLLGIVLILLFAYLFSTDRKAIRSRTVLVGLALQFLFAILVLRVSYGERHDCRRERGEPALELLLRRFAIRLWRPGQQTVEVWRPLRLSDPPIIIFIAAFFAICTTTASCSSSSGNSQSDDALHGGQRRGIDQRCGQRLYGQTEAPFTVRPFLPKVTRSELMTIMTSGMAHVSGAVMGAYIARASRHGIC